MYAITCNEQMIGFRKTLSEARKFAEKLAINEGIAHNVYKFVGTFDVDEKGVRWSN